MEYDLISIGKRITEIRDSLGLTKEKFGNSLGVTSDAIYNIENARNKTISMPIIIAIAAKYNFEENWILYGKEPKHSNNISVLDKLKDTYNLSNLEFAILDGYLKLDKTQRVAFENFLDTVITNKDDNYDEVNEASEEAVEIIGDNGEINAEKGNSKIG